jgi:hypothetical protein
MSGATTTVRRLRVLEALGLLVLARVLRRYVPMRRWARLLGEPGPPTVPMEVAPLTGDEALVARAVASGARRLSANCLEQAVAASLMLRRRGSGAVVVIGLDPQRPQGIPHAWLVGRSGTVVVGGEEMPGFRPVNQFGRLRASGRLR